MIPYFGYSPQAGPTYFMHKLPVYIGGLVDHATGKNYSYIIDKTQANNLNSEHTLNIFAKLVTIKNASLITFSWIDNNKPKWVNHLEVYMDNTVKTNKNSFINTFFRELIARNKLKSVQLSFCIRGHTKKSIISLLQLISSQFQPDVLFANVSHTYKHQDVFTLHKMQSIYSVYSKCTCIVRMSNEKLLSYIRELWEPAVPSGTPGTKPQ